MSRPAREIVCYTRPICQNEKGGRCRKTAVLSIDGVWLCKTHSDPAHSDYAKQFGTMFGVPIVWLRFAKTPHGGHCDHYAYDNERCLRCGARRLS